MWRSPREGESAPGDELDWDDDLDEDKPALDAMLLTLSIIVMVVVVPVAAFR